MAQAKGSGMVEQELRAFFSEHGVEWITEQEARFRAAGHPLPPDIRGYVAPYFGAVLADVTVSSVAITNPPWYDDLKQRGVDERDLLNFSRVQGITFNTSINISPEVAWDLNLVFHELVHVVQYRALGIGEFAHRYVDGWFAGRLLLDYPEQRYFYIPLERQAFDLAQRYGAGGAPFSVEAAVRGATI